MKRALLVAIALTACSKKEEPKPGASKPTEKPEPAKQEPAGPWDAWDMKARHAAWQGSWTTLDGTLVVAGETATAGDKKLAFALLSPCEAKLTETGPDGSSSSTITHYTIKDGALIAGLGSAGSKKGKEAIACVSNVLLTLDASGTCTEWKDSWGEGKYEKRPATCAFSADGTKFVATVNGSEHELLVDGDALMTQQLAGSHYVRTSP